VRATASSGGDRRQGYHAGVDDTRSAASEHGRRLAAAIGLGATILVVEIVAGIASGSLALLADAGHMFADVSGMALSLGAIWLAARVRTDGRTFGLYRLEILAATVNAVALLVISAIVIVEGLRRLTDPPPIESGLVVVVALGAVVANAVSIWLLSHGRHASLTIRSAYLEVLGDLLGAGAVLVAGAVIALTGWRPADAIASILIGLLIVPRTLGLLRESVVVLPEANRRGVDMGEVRGHSLGAQGVV